MKYRLTKDHAYDTIYALYVKKLFGWKYLLHFSASDEQTAIQIAKEKALAYSTPVAEFEI